MVIRELKHEKDYNDWLESVREIYKKKKREISPGEIKPIDFTFKPKGVEPVYFAKTNVYCYAKYTDKERRTSFLISLLVLSNQKVFLLHDDKTDIICMEDIEFITVGLFGIMIQTNKKFENICLILRLEDIVYIETMAEKFGITVKKEADMLGQIYENFSISGSNLQYSAQIIFNSYQPRLGDKK